MQSKNEEERGSDPHGPLKHGRADQMYNDANAEYDIVTPSSEPDSNDIHGHTPVKTAYYNAASEKSLSHEEAKLFYQRHQLEQSQHISESENPLSRARTVSSGFDVDGRLSRATSTASRRNVRGYAARDQVSRPAADPKSQLSSVKDTDLQSTDEDAESTTDNANVEADVMQQHAIEGENPNATMQGPDISPELSAICAHIKRILDIRHDYVRLSLQGPRDNPKDSSEWEIYPPPPNPTWDNNKNRPAGQTSGANSLSNSRSLPEEPEGPDTPSMKRRKPGHDIGEDFEVANLLPLPGNDEHFSFGLDQGSVYKVYKTSTAQTSTRPIVKVPTLRDFYKDMDEIQAISSDGPTKSFAYRQLDILAGKFQLYSLVNSYQETADSKKVPHRDFYNVRKVDTHVHHSACMNQKHLLRFIKSKMKKSPDEIVMFRDNKELTLQQVFDSISLTAYDLSIDTLDMHVS